MRPLRRLLSVLRGFDLARFDRIEDYGLALVHVECQRRAVERVDAYEGFSPGREVPARTQGMLDQLAFRYAQERTIEQLAELAMKAPSTSDKPWAKN